MTSESLIRNLLAAISVWLTTLSVSSHCPWIYNCVGINNHRHFFLYLINLALGIISYDWLIYYCRAFCLQLFPFSSLTLLPPDFSNIDPSVSDQCNLLAPSICRVVNADSYTMILTMWTTLHLTWVTMLLFVQFIQVARAMTTYENMFGVGHHSAASLNSVFTSTGAPLDPSQRPLAGSTALPGAAADGQGHGHRHRHKGFLKQWSQLLGVDAFIETATGRGAATGSKNKRRKRNPYSQGCLANCRDFWCDPAPVFGRRDTGAAVLGGHAVNYTDMYESPGLMDASGGRSGGYQPVAGEEV